MPPLRHHLHPARPQPKAVEGVTVVGIDPGVSGGFAITYPSGYVEAYNMPTDERAVVDLITLLQHNAGKQSPEGKLVVYLELVTGFIGNAHPGSRMFTFGENFGVIKGACRASGIDFKLVRPQQWQVALQCGSASEFNHLNKGQKKTAWKRKLKQYAAALYPDLRVTNKTSDALLIMAAGIRDQLGLTPWKPDSTSRSWQVLPLCLFASGSRSKGSRPIPRRNTCERAGDVRPHSLQASLAFKERVPVGREKIKCARATSRLYLRPPPDQTKSCTSSWGFRQLNWLRVIGAVKYGLPHDCHT